MKKVLLLSLFLLLTPMLLPAVSAVGPPLPPDRCTATFSGDIIGSDDELVLDSKKSAARVYTPPLEKTSLTFVETTEGLWYVNETLDFAGIHEGKLLIAIDKRTGEATIYFEFGEQEVTVIRKGKEERIVTVPEWRLIGTGSYAAGTVTVTVGQEFEIDAVVAGVTGKGHGGIGLAFPKVCDVSLDFTIVISPPP